jgi:DNA-binding PadR family transcriptional regulator
MSGFSKLQVLQFIRKWGGEVDLYPLTEMGAYGVLCDLVNDGFVDRIKVEGGLDLFRLTEAGCQAVATQSSSADMNGGEGPGP